MRDGQPQDTWVGELSSETKGASWETEKMQTTKARLIPLALTDCCTWVIRPVSLSFQVGQRSRLNSLPAAAPLCRWLVRSSRPLLSPGTLTQWSSLLLLGSPQLVWLVQGHVLEHVWKLKQQLFLLCHSGLCPFWGHGVLPFDGCRPHPLHFGRLCGGHLPDLVTSTPGHTWC